MDLTNVTWRKATSSGSNGGDCVELASLPRLVAVRDSKNPDGPKLAFSRATFSSLAVAMKNH